MILGNRDFIELPGVDVYELPPLLLQSAEKPSQALLMEKALEAIDPDDEFLPDTAKVDIALTLIDKYWAMRQMWSLGDSLLDWVRQCEDTFQHSKILNQFVGPNVWPHANRSSFVSLAEDKQASEHLKEAVGLRLVFRRVPPISCCSDQLLHYLNPTLGETAFCKWSDMAPHMSLPPERFSFEVLSMGLSC